MSAVGEIHARERAALSMRTRHKQHALTRLAQGGASEGSRVSPRSLATTTIAAGPCQVEDAARPAGANAQVEAAVAGLDRLILAAGGGLRGPRPNFPISQFPFLQ